MNIKNNFKRLYIITWILFVFFPLSNYAQRKDRILNLYLKELNVTFNSPAGFTGLDSDVSFRCKEIVHINPFNYVMINESEDIVLCISFQELRGLWDSYNKPGLLFKKFDPNKGYLITTRLHADSNNTPIIHYSKEYNQSNSNAATEYVLNCTNVFMDKYNYCKVVMLHKESWADIQVYYFYTDKAKNKVDNYIKKTAGMLKFKDGNGK